VGFDKQMGAACDLLLAAESGRRKQNGCGRLPVCGYDQVSVNVCHPSFLHEWRPHKHDFAVAFSIA